MRWFCLGQRPEGTPAPTAAAEKAAKSSAISITAGARIRGQVSTGALCFDQEVLSLRFLLEGVAATFYQLQLLMLCIGLWMLVEEASFKDDAAVGNWRKLVTDSLEAAEAINPDLPLPDTYADSHMDENMILRKWHLLPLHAGETTIVKYCVLKVNLPSQTCGARGMPCHVAHSLVIWPDHMVLYSTYV